MARRVRQSGLPPPLEQSCLGIVWTRGEATVRDVMEALPTPEPLAYTTVMTLLERLVRRGHLARRKAGRRFVYTPASDPAALRQRAVEDVIRDYFGGSREALLAWLDAPQAQEKTRFEPPAPESMDTTLL